MNARTRQQARALDDPKCTPRCILAYPKKRKSPVERGFQRIRWRKRRPASGAYWVNSQEEGVVLSKKLEALFRVVPPSLFLALAMTEAERWKLMQDHKCSELQAAMRVANRIEMGAD